MEIENQTAAFIKAQSSKSLTVLTTIHIPVIVHLLYNTSDQNISDDQIQSQIEVLNEYYNRLNADTTNTPEAFSNIADDACMNLFTTGQVNRMKALFSSGGDRECFVLNPSIYRWCNSIMTLTGATLVCTSNSTFTLHNRPPGTTVNWNKSSNLQYVSG